MEQMYLLIFLEIVPSTKLFPIIGKNTPYYAWSLYRSLAYFYAGKLLVAWQQLHV